MMKSIMKKSTYCGLLLSVCLLPFIYNDTNQGFGLAYYGNVIAVEFSGITLDDLNACPWLVNHSTNELLGFNEEFRAYFENDIKYELNKYPHVFDQDDPLMEIRYTGFDHEFKSMSQEGVEEEYFEEDYPVEYDPLEFDPYYCLVWVRFTDNTTARYEAYNTTIAQTLETTLINKWYIDKAKILIDLSGSGLNLSFSIFGGVTGLMVLGIAGKIILRKKKSA